MKRIITLIVIFLIINNLMSQKNFGVSSINSVSFKLLEQLFNAKENCFYSPYSIFGALSMTYAGAKENTKLEMEAVLELGQKEKIYQDFKELSDAITFERELTILSANSLWIQKSLKPDKNYLNLVQEYFNAKVEKVDFSGENDREKSRKQINEWIEKQTKENLKDFVPKGIIDESTVILIVNAVYFNALWEVEFLSEKTKIEYFWATASDSLSCEMMNSDLETKYYEDDLMQVVEIPYQSNKASMLVLLPKKDSEINNESFNSSYLKKAIEGLSVREVNLSIPKFKLETSYELSDCLQKMGIKSAFSPGADFSGITGTKNLMLDKILHKSVIDVSEKGTEASSATAIISMRSTKIAKEPAEFKANRPFYFVIKYNPNNLILFMGYVVNPGKTDNSHLKQ